MNIQDLIELLQKDAGLKPKDIAEILTVSDKTLRSWKKGVSVPSNHQVQNILHLAKLFNIDTSGFKWETYIESVLRITYMDEYRICNGIDETNFMVHLARINGEEGFVPIEEVTNKVKELFKYKKDHQK